MENIIKLHNMAANFIGDHWDGGIGIPDDFTALPVQEKLEKIYAAQEEGCTEKCAYLKVKFDDDGWINFLHWESGSRRGAIVMAQHIIVLVDCGTFATGEMNEIHKEAVEADMDVYYVRVDSRVNGFSLKADDVLEKLWENFGLPREE